VIYLNYFKTVYMDGVSTSRHYVMKNLTDGF
jgi:hypothetical protein